MFSTNFYIVYSSYDPEQFAGSHIPILVIGTKLDQVTQALAATSGSPGLRDSPLHRSSSSIAEECGADEINLVNHDLLNNI